MSTETAESTTGREKSRKRKLIGIVVSDKMDKTRVVMVSRRFSHLKYGKFLTARKKYKAHDEKNAAKVGDVVEIIEARPMSRSKRWRILRTLSHNAELPTEGSEAGKAE